MKRRRLIDYLVLLYSTFNTLFYLNILTRVGLGSHRVLDLYLVQAVREVKCMFCVDLESIENVY